MDGWTRPGLVVLVAALVSASCGAPPVEPDVMRPVLETRDVPPQAWQERPPDDEVEDRTRALFEEPLEVDDAIRVALLNHPKLRANLQQLRASRATAFQEALVANPRVDAEFLFGEHTELEAEATFDLASLVHLSLRRDIARGEYEQARLRAAQGVVELMYDVQRAYYDHVAGRQLLEFERHIHEAARAQAIAAEELFEAGNITEFELATQQSFASEVRLEVIRAEANVEASRQRLHEAIGLEPRQHDWEVAGRLPELPDEPIDVDEVADRAVDNNLALDRLAHDVELGESRARLERRQGWLPRLEAGVGVEYRLEEQRPAVGPVVGITIPLFDRRQHAVDARRAEALGAAYRRQALEGRIRAQAQSLAHRLEAADRQARHLQAQVIPLHERTAGQAMRQFNAMEINVFELLQVRRDQMRVGRQYIEALHNYWSHRARASRFIAGGDIDNGAPLPDDDRGPQPAGADGH